MEPRTYTLAHLKPVRALYTDSLREIGVGIYHLDAYGERYHVVLRLNMTSNDPRWRKEREIQEALRNPGHPAIPHIFHFIDIEGHPATLEEAVPIHTLRSIVRSAAVHMRNNPILLPPGFVAYTLLKVAEAVAYIQDKRIEGNRIIARSVHPDLLGFIANSTEIRFLVLSHFREEEGAQLTLMADQFQVYSDNFYPPEFLDAVIREAWDIWSIGMLGYYMLRGEAPYPMLVSERVRLVDYRPETHEKVRAKLDTLERLLRANEHRFGRAAYQIVPLLRACLNPQPEQRPEIQSLIADLLKYESRVGLKYSEIRALIGLLSGTQYSLEMEHIVESLMKSMDITLPGAATAAYRSPPSEPPKTTSETDPDATAEDLAPIRIRFGPLGRMLLRLLLKEE